MGIPCIKTKTIQSNNFVSKQINNYTYEEEEYLSNEIYQTSMRYKLKVMLKMTDIYETTLKPLQYNKPYYEKMSRVYFMSYYDLYICINNLEDTLKEYRTIALEQNNTDIIQKVDKCLHDHVYY